MIHNAIFFVEGGQIFLTAVGARTGGYYARFDGETPPNQQRANRIRAAIERAADRLAIELQRMVVIKALHPKYPKLTLQLGEAYPIPTKIPPLLPTPPPVYEELAL